MRANGRDSDGLTVNVTLSGNNYIGVVSYAPPALYANGRGYRQGERVWEFQPTSGLGVYRGRLLVKYILGIVSQQWISTEIRMVDYDHATTLQTKGSKWTRVR